MCLFGVFSARRTPTDIFPEIDIPVVSVVWSYNGMAAQEIQTRIINQHERQMASLVDDIERVESNSYNGVGVIKVYLHEGANISRAVSQITSSALTVLKNMPRNITPPLVVRYSATDVPIIQLSLASDTLPDVKLNDYGQNVIRPFLATVQGAQVPYPYGGKPRLIMADLDMQALRAKNLTPERRHRGPAQPEPDPALRHGQGRRHRLRHPDEQQHRHHRGDERLPDQAGRQRHGVPPRRGPRPQRLPGADQLGQRGRRCPAA